MIEKIEDIQHAIHGFKPGRDLPIDRKSGKPTPYIIFKHYPNRSTKDAKEPDNSKADYFRLRVEGSHGTQDKVQYYLNKGFEVFEFYLPDRPKDDPYQGFTDFGDIGDNIQQLRGFVTKLGNRVSKDEHEKALNENEVIKKRLAEAEKKLKEAEANKADKAVKPGATA